MSASAACASTTRRSNGRCFAKKARRRASDRASAAQGERPLDLAELADQAVIIYPREPRPSYADQVLSLLSDHGVALPVVHEVRELQTALGLVAAEDGIALCPRRCTRWDGATSCFASSSSAPPRRSSSATARTTTRPARGYVRRDLGALRALGLADSFRRRALPSWLRNSRLGFYIATGKPCSGLRRQYHPLDAPCRMMFHEVRAH